MRFPLFRRRAAAAPDAPFPVLTAAPRAAPAAALPLTAPPPPSPGEYRLYDALRWQVPVVDAALRKIVRLAGGFRLVTDSEAGQAILDRFAEHVPVNAAGQSLQLFADQMLDSLLTYGNAAGEIIPDSEDGVAALRTAHPGILRLHPRDAGGCDFAVADPETGEEHPLRNPERVLFAALDPPAGAVYGASVLRGLPAISGILLRIYECIGQNYDRAGNVRYAVCYRPDAENAPFVQEHVQEIASAWRDGIRAAGYGEVQDFITAGDVEIKVIGADNHMLDTNIPVRQLLEQIISKLSIPPFLLGFSWATTERMSTQQADILTSELEYFRRILTPILRTIGEQVLHSCGIRDDVRVEWSFINLQDETALAEARLRNAQAAEIEQRLSDAQ